MRVRLMMVVVAALLALPGAARAGTVASFTTPLFRNVEEGTRVLGAGHVVSGPVLAGDQVVWAQETGGGTVALLAVPAAGGVVPRTLVTLPPADAREQSDHGVDLQGSPTRLAYFEHQSYIPPGEDKYQQGFTFQARIAAGPPGGPFATVAGCAQLPACDGHRVCFDDGRYGNAVHWALSGDALALSDQCAPDGTRSPGANTLRRADLAAGTPPAATPVQYGHELPLALSGDLVATEASPGVVTVRRLADGTSLGSYPAPPPDLRPEYRVAVLGPDGTLAETAISDGHQTASGLYWLAPGAPRARFLPFPLRFGEQLVQIAGSRLIVRAPDAPGTGWVLDVVDLATGAVAPILRLPHSPDAAHAGATLLGAALDPSGRIAWAVSSCERTTIATAAAGDPPQTVAPAVCDSARIVSRTLSADRRGRFTVGVVCGRACSGTLRTYVGGELQTIFTRFRLRGAARVQRVSVRLTGRALTRLRRTGRAGVTLHVAGQDAVAPKSYVVRLRGR